MTGEHGGSALAGARQRMAARPAGALVAKHLQAHYGVEVRGQSELDLGVYRIDRTDGPGWVARVFPASRPEAATAGDAEILAYLALRNFESERAAAPQPVSVIDGRTVLVTELVTGVPQTERAAAIRARGGLRRLGEMLGELHALPAGTGAVGRPGGAWHHLADGLPAEEIRAAQALLADSEDTVAAAERPLHAALRRELADADGGEGLPHALVHPDFVLANVIASPDRGMVLVDWTGTGRGPRAWSLAFLLFAEGAKNPRRAGLVLAGLPEPGQPRAGGDRSSPGADAGPASRAGHVELLPGPLKPGAGRPRRGRGAGGSAGGWPAGCRRASGPAGLTPAWTARCRSG